MSSIESHLSNKPKQVFFNPINIFDTFTHSITLLYIFNILFSFNVNFLIYSPYDGGCFKFDLYCPTTYPNGPPKCHLMTTGSGTVRFNPNLYDSGYVCLTVLNAKGSGGQTWRKNQSNILEVILAIEYFCLNAMYPLFNEPSEESNFKGMNTDASTKTRVRTAHWSGSQFGQTGYQPVREGTIKYAMIDMIRNPPNGFEDAVREHFLLKGKYITRQIEGWITDSERFPDAVVHRNTLKNLMNEFLMELWRLDPRYEIGGQPIATPAPIAIGGDWTGTPTPAAIVLTWPLETVVAHLKLLNMPHTGDLTVLRKSLKVCMDTKADEIQQNQKRVTDVAEGETKTNRSQNQDDNKLSIKKRMTLKKFDKKEDKHTVMISNIQESNEIEIRKLFQSCGTIVKITTVSDAIIEIKFNDVTSYTKCLKMNGTTVKKNKIVVKKKLEMKPLFFQDGSDLGPVPIQAINEEYEYHVYPF